MVGLKFEESVIKSSAKQYAIVWGVENSENSRHMIALNASVFSGSSWSDLIKLYASSVDDYVTGLQVASNDNGFLVGWVKNSGEAYEIDTVGYSNNVWDQHAYDQRGYV